MARPRMHYQAMLRAARSDDLPKLGDLERAAGESFRDVGMDLVADDEPFSVAELAAYQEDGRAWVVADEADEPVAYLLLDVVDGNGHVEQVSVHPDHAGGRLGARLVDAAAAWAEARGLEALTLTTYAEVPWNGPYYERLGFRPLAGAGLTPGLRRIREREAAHGLDRWPRIAMRRELRAA
jgi:GNAT superfamily N-acetyltransferase